MGIESRSTGKRVFIVGLDGATLDLLCPWAEQGELPLLQDIFQRGAVGELESTVPPVTPVAWLSFMTGKGPGRHGVFDLLRPVTADYMEIAPAYGHHCRESTLWDILSSRGRKVGLINVPMTYPPKPVNGFMISGIPAPANKDPYSYPASLVPELKQLGWDLTRDASAATSSYSENLQYLAELVETRTQAALHLMTHHEWDLFMVHFLETDQVQHTYWRFMDGDGTGSTAPARCRTAILDLFKRIETSLGRMMELLDEDTILILLSDHGMGPTRYHIDLNNWLVQAGLMSWKRTMPVGFKRALYALGLHPTSLYRLLASRWVKRLPLGRLRGELTHVPSSASDDRPPGRRRLAGLIRDLLCLSMKDVDWSRTLAYSSGTTQAGFVYVNLKGREPQGAVAQGKEYENLRAFICEKAVDYVDPMTGDRPFAHAYRKEELYSGPHVRDAPDIVVLCSKPEYNTPLGRLFLTNRVVEPISNATASHRMSGLVAMKGSGVVRRGCVLTNAQITDLAPTILYLMGEPIPSDMDGKVLRDCLNHSFVEGNPERYSDAEEAPGSLPAEQAEEMSPEDVESLRRTLEGLGYL